MYENKRLGLLYHGISAISLVNTGSERVEGARACVSQVKDEQLADLEKRLRAFQARFPPA